MEKLKKIFLLISLIGILLLLFISRNLEPKTINVYEINESLLNQRVKISGQILDSWDYSNNTFHVLKLKENLSIIDVIFNTKSQEFKFNSSKVYTIIGKVQKYNQTIQISADKILSMP